jgi:sugar phosphate isomerase/epimerase
MNLSDISLNIYSFGYAAGFMRDAARRLPPLDLEGLVRCALGHRLGGVEFPIDRYFDIQHIDDGVSTVKAIQDRGLRVFLDLETMDIAYLKALLPNFRVLNMEVARVKMDQFGSTIYGGNRYLSPTFFAALSHFKSQLRELRPLLEDSGVVLAIENHQDLHSSELIAICDEGCGSLGLTWDVGNSVSVVDTPESFFATAGTRVRNVHLKDYTIAHTERGVRLTRCPAGQGYVDFRAVLKRLTNSQGIVNMSIELGAQMSRECDIQIAEYWAPYRDLPISSEVFLDYVLLQIKDAHAPKSAMERGLGEEQLIKNEFAEIEASVAHLDSILTEIRDGQDR